MKTIASFTLIGFTFFAFGLSNGAICQAKTASQNYASVGSTTFTPNEPVSKVFTPKLSLLQDQGGESLHIINPDHDALTIQVKDANDHQVDGWVVENFETTDAKQTISFGDLKPGIYWVEISSPEKQSVWFKWEKK